MVDKIGTARGRLLKIEIRNIRKNMIKGIAIVPTNEYNVIRKQQKGGA